MSADYTPTTEQVRDQYRHSVDEYGTGDGLAFDAEEAGSVFDRWLAAHDAEVTEALRVMVEALEGQRRDAWTRAEAAEAQRDEARAKLAAVKDVVVDWGAGTVHAPRSPYYKQLIAALSDEAGAR